MSGVSSIFQLFNYNVNIYKPEVYESGCCYCSVVNIQLLQVMFCSRYDAEVFISLPANLSLAVTPFLQWETARLPL